MTTERCAEYSGFRSNLTIFGYLQCVCRRQATLSFSCLISPILRPYCATKSRWANSTELNTAKSSFKEEAYLICENKFLFSFVISRNLRNQDKGKAFNVSRGNKSKVSIYFPAKQNKALKVELAS